MSIKVHRERPSRTNHQARSLVGSDLELPVLRRTARDLEGDLVGERDEAEFVELEGVVNIGSTDRCFSMTNGRCN